MVGMRRKGVRTAEPERTTSSSEDRREDPPAEDTLEMQPLPRRMMDPSTTVAAATSHHHNSKSSKRYRTLRLWWQQRSQWQRYTILYLSAMIVCLTGIYHIIFYIRYFTMSRPKWLYGSPSTLSLQELEQCLVEDPSASTSTLPPIFEYHWYRAATHPSNEAVRESSIPSSTASLQQQQQQQQQQPSKSSLLIAQYSSYGKYAQMLDVVAPINAQYAHEWGYDYVVLQGTALSFSGISQNCHYNQEARSTFNKIILLEEAFRLRHQYSHVLILDTDAMIVNFQVDLAHIVSSEYLVAAHRVWRYDWKTTWDINAGITLWNLHHPSLPQVLQEWKTTTLQNPKMVLERNDDQYFLQLTLLRLGTFWNRPVYSLNRQEFEYYQATLIQHYKRDARSWSTTSLEERILRIHEAIGKLQCQKGHGHECAHPQVANMHFASRQPPP